MDIFINNRQAVLKKGMSFEFVAENRLFSGSDAFSLSIPFPLKDCKENIDIFGIIFRDDVTPPNLIFDCEIKEGNFHRFGSLAITEINEAEVTCQFLEGRSEQNFFKSLDKIYINELDLGQWPTDFNVTSDPNNVWKPNRYSNICVALPWVNDGTGNMQNKASVETIYDDAGNELVKYRWDVSVSRGISWQPYLLYITQRICSQIGYSFDPAKWMAREDLRYLLICNCLPAAWEFRDFARAMPRWTVEEFFAKLELFLNAEFDIDHRRKSISMEFVSEKLEALPAVVLEDVVDEFSSELDVEDPSCAYKGLKNIVYSDPGYDSWKFYSCPWMLDSGVSIIPYDNVEAIVRDLRDRCKSYSGVPESNTLIHHIYYARQEDAHFIIDAYKQTVIYNEYLKRNLYRYDCRLRPLNLLGGHIVNPSDDAECVELDFVPVRIDETDDARGRVMFLSPGSYQPPVGEADKNAAKHYDYPAAQRVLVAGKPEKNGAFYDKVFIGWYAGVKYRTKPNLPAPAVENIEVANDWSSVTKLPFSLRLNSRDAINSRSYYHINPKKKTSFSFLSHSIPEVRSLFIINGKRYLCEKITATFTEDGMSQLLKGVFYPVEA